jgi:glycerophosphoryl diester phosphodiesterase
MRFSLLSPLDRLISPPPQPGRVAFLDTRPYAHRGLHGVGVIENSRAAFHAAIAGGFGIEFDVQSAIGGEPFVFHDYEFDRLAEAQGPVSGSTGDQVATIRLKGSAETIPRLSEVLALVGGRVPILIEVKTKGRRIGAFCLAIRRALEGYQGPFAIMSFNPEVVRWFYDHAPRIVRGLVVTEEGKKGLRGRVERHLSLWRAKPDFLAYDIRDFPSRFPALLRARGLKVLTWTVRTPDQNETAKANTDQIIFEKPAAR